MAKVVAAPMLPAVKPAARLQVVHTLPALAIDSDEEDATEVVLTKKSNTRPKLKDQSNF
jgi:hypothetical protein